MYVALFNLSDETRRVAVPAEAVELPAAEAVELWTKQPAQTLSAELPPHDAAVFLVRRANA